MNRPDDPIRPPTGLAALIATVVLAILVLGVAAPHAGAAMS